MKKLIQILLYPVIFLALNGCSQNMKYLNPKQFYSLKDTIKGKIISTPLRSYYNLYYTEYGLFTHTRLDNNIFQLLDSTNANMITATGERGRGPNEFLSVSNTNYDYLTNKFAVLDFYKQELITYLVSPDSISLIRRVNLKQDLQRVEYMNDSLLVFINFYPNQKIGLVNTKAEVIYAEEYNTLDDGQIKTTNAYHSVSMGISPDKKHTVVADSKFTSIKVFLNKPNTLELKWAKMLFKPEYSPQKGWYTLREKHYSGFRSLALTNQYIYLCCDDIPMINIKQKVPNSKHTYILVMDYEGNIVTKYLLDKYISLFTVSPNGKSLYAMIDDPDLLIVKYSLISDEFI